MIIVTGATGQLGHRIVEKLVGLVPAGEVGVSVRDPQKAGELTALGIRVRPGNFDDPQSLRHAFEGATQVLIISSNARAYGGDPLAQHRTAIEAARAVGARRIVYTSQIAASPSSAFPPARDHAATEEMLRESGLAWTALRHGFYASSGLLFMGDALKTSLISAPADGRVNWTAHSDLAEADAIILASEGRYDGPTPPLAASEGFDLAGLAAIASELLNSPVRRETITDEELRARMAARGMPALAIDMTVSMYVASRAGEFATNDSTLEQLLGRRPITMRDVLSEKVSSEVAR